jgi:hypothetical protein
MITFMPLYIGNKKSIIVVHAPLGAAVDSGGHRGSGGAL